jgi:hypothetical protein
MLYTIYKTTNLVNGKFYLGRHKTLNLEDGYLGQVESSESFDQEVRKRKFSKGDLRYPEEAFRKEYEGIELYFTRILSA